MKKIFQLGSFLLGFAILFTACSGLSSSALPSSFWGLMSWNYSPRTDGAYSVEGSATVKMHFTETEPGKYEITGTVEPTETSCTEYQYFTGYTCSPIWCKVESVTSGTLAGSASLEGQTLTVSPRWDTPFAIHVENMCNPIPDATVLGPSKNDASIMESLGSEDEPFFTKWTIDVTDLQFVDGIPTNELTDANVGAKNFSAEGIYSSGTGLFGLYQNEPE